MHARSYSDGMETLGTVQDDVSAVRDFASRVRALCAQLTANPFNTPAAEKLLDLLLEDAPAVDLAFERVLRSVNPRTRIDRRPDPGHARRPTLHRPECRTRRRRGGLKSALMSAPAPPPKPGSTEHWQAWLQRYGGDYTDDAERRAAYQDFTTNSAALQSVFSQANDMHTAGYLEAHERVASGDADGPDDAETWVPGDLTGHARADWLEGFRSHFEP